MTDAEVVRELFSPSSVTPVPSEEGMYEIKPEGRVLADRTILVRFVSRESDHDALLQRDNKILERRFYDEGTPNPWNIQLFWIHEADQAPSKRIRTKLEDDTRFAIRRSIASPLIREFLTPLEEARESLSRLSERFNRNELIESILDEDLGFLLNDPPIDDAWELLREGSEDPTDSTFDEEIINPPQSFIRSIDLGDFRPGANLRSTELTDFSLLFGRNASGKTSLLDGITLGMVGQARREPKRVDSYEDLEVKLRDVPESLAKDASTVNDRIQGWYGFRPHGPEKKHVEFYRVNYLEAGSAARLAETGDEMDLQRTLRRFLFGEELTKAKRKKDSLLEKLDSRRQEIEEKKESLSDRLGDLESQRERQERIFGELDAASDSLSSSTARILSKEDADRQGDRIERWTSWLKRYDLIEDALDRAGLQGDGRVHEIKEQLRAAIQAYREDEERIQNLSEVKARKTRLNRILQNYSDAGLQPGLPPSTVYLALTLKVSGVTMDELGSLLAVKDSFSLGSGPSSMETWSERVRHELDEEAENLEERIQTCQELESLGEQRIDLETDIREKTVYYLSLVDEVDHCPACFLEQTKQDILDRERPSTSPPEDEDSSTSTIESLEERRQAIRDVLELLDSSSWLRAMDTLESDSQDKCGTSDLENLLEGKEILETLDEITRGASSKTRLTVAKLIKTTEERGSFRELLEAAIEHLTHKEEEIKSKVQNLDPEPDAEEPLEDELGDTLDDLQSGLQIIEEFWPAEQMEDPVDFPADRRIMKSTVSSIQAEADDVRLTAEFDDEIESINGELEDIQKELPELDRDEERLRRAFEGSAGEGRLARVVEDHMRIVSTFFLSFQRPFEFEEVYMNDDGKLRVLERNSESERKISQMSSGQRAALALAIFAANNLAHDHAPPIMLLDEPFAHLDDINVTSFFNLLLGLVEDEDRQIIFATASKNLADLLQRKAGHSDQFEKRTIPTIREDAA